MGNAEEKMTKAVEKIQKALDASTPCRTVFKQRMSNFWCTPKSMSRREYDCQK